MSYTIRVRVIQTKPSVWYSIVEKTNWSGSTWSDVDGEQFLIMETSGTSGMLRLKNHAGDVFMVALGVHNYKRLCDIVVDQKSDQTSVDILPTYYSSGPRNEMLWKQLACIQNCTSQGRHVRVDFYKEDGHTLYATITID